MKKNNKKDILKKESSINKNIKLVWSEFFSLKQTHPCHIEKFCDAIHDLQQIMMWRELQRLNPSKYPTYNE